MAKDDLSGTYFESAMRQMINRGWIGGYEDGSYRPKNPVTRAEFTSMLVRVFELTEQKGQAKSFKDVKKGKWYYHPIQVASSHNLIGGYDDGTFRPNNKINRQEMAAMVLRAMKKQGVTTGEQPLNFADNNRIHPMFQSTVKQLLFLGVFSGKTINGKIYFAPHDKTTRGETAAIILRMVNRINNPKMIITRTHYEIDFNKAIDAQMKQTPKVDGAGLYLASRALVTYYANPSNFNVGTEEYLQFLVLSQSAGLNAKEVNEKILAGKGKLAGQADAFIQAAKRHNVNEVYLIAHALHETGNGTSTLAMGVPVDGNGNIVSKDKAKHTVYNFYGYGAVDSDPLRGGAKYAFDRGWFTPKDAIIGGAADVANNYIKRGQDTLYKMRWNPASPGYPQYATHVQWAVLQTKRMHAIYQLLDNYVLRFDVPVYKNQPGPTTLPTGVAQYHVDTKLKGEKGKVTASALNLRTGPTTNFSIITTLSKGTTFTVLGENGPWYKIEVNGKNGWVSKQYVQLDRDVKSLNMIPNIELPDKEADELSPEEAPDMETPVEEIPESDTEKDNESAPTDEEDNVIDEKETINALKGIITKEETPVIIETSDPEDPVMTSFLEIGTEVEIIDYKDGWYKVVINDAEGWILEDDVEILESE